jgi:hypothetical protein
MMSQEDAVAGANERVIGTRGARGAPYQIAGGLDLGRLVTILLTAVKRMTPLRLQGVGLMSPTRVSETE